MAGLQTPEENFWGMTKPNPHPLTPASGGQKQTLTIRHTERQRSIQAVN